MKQKTNNETDTADLRYRSEYTRVIEDFTKYIMKEYIEASDDKSLLICSMDASVGDNKVGCAHIVLGNPNLTTSGLASMMSDERTSHIFRKARLASTLNDDIFSDAVSVFRKRLRVHNLILAFNGVWVAVLIALSTVGSLRWTYTVSALFTVAFSILLVWWSRCDCRRRLARLEMAEEQDTNDRKVRRMAAMFQSIANRMRQNDDD